MVMRTEKKIHLGSTLSEISLTAAKRVSTINVGQGY